MTRKAFPISVSRFNLRLSLFPVHTAEHDVHDAVVPMTLSPARYTHTSSNPLHVKHPPISWLTSLPPTGASRRARHPNQMYV